MISCFTTGQNHHFWRRKKNVSEGEAPHLLHHSQMVKGFIPSVEREAFYICFYKHYVFFLEKKKTNKQTTTHPQNTKQTNKTFRKTKFIYRYGLRLAKNIDSQNRDIFFETITLFLWYFFLSFAKHNFSLFIAERHLEF